jgi:NAD kinase
MSAVSVRTEHRDVRPARAVGARPRTRREKVVIVTRKTQLEELVARFNTVGQARFYLEQAGEDFAPLEATHAQYHAVLGAVRSMVPAGVKQQVIDRAFLPQFTFGEADLVVTVGPDGLVVNTAKYLSGQPIIAANPDPARIEGVLLPFTVKQVGAALALGIYGEPKTRKVTMAEAALSDGQRLLAFNDLFIGVKSHVSARYRLESDGRAEEQSSSGIIVSTGAGSTGWLKSVYTGAARVIEALGGTVKPAPNAGRFPWEAERLVYAVREPWPSKSTGASLVYGVITKDRPLVVTSRMADNGVIFSDGVEADYLAFNAGFRATIRIAEKKANLVVAA